MESCASNAPPSPDVFRRNKTSLKLTTEPSSPSPPPLVAVWFSAKIQCSMSIFEPYNNMPPATLPPPPVTVKPLNNPNEPIAVIVVEAPSP